MRTVWKILSGSKKESKQTLETSRIWVYHSDGERPHSTQYPVVLMLRYGRYSTFVDLCGVAIVKVDKS
jgi:DNA modification methylase